MLPNSGFQVDAALRDRDGSWGGIVTVKRMDNVGIVVEDIDDTLVRLVKRGAALVGEVVGQQASRADPMARRS